MFDSLWSGSLTTTLLIGLCTGLVVYWFIQRLKYKLPPGIWCPPLVGHLLQIDMNTAHKDVIQWSKKYGPLVTYYAGPKAIVFVNKIDVALELLVKKSTDFANRYTSCSMMMISDDGKDIALSDYNPTWKLHRRISSKALRQYMVGPALENRVHAALDTAFKEMDHQQGKSFDCEEYINFIVGNILTSMCFGGKYDFDNKEVSYLLERQDQFLAVTMVMEDFFPPMRHVYKTQAFRDLEQFKYDVIDQFIGNRFNEAKKTFDKNNIRHFMDNLILAREEAIEENAAELESLTETHLIQTIGDIFFAGIDTSRYTLRFAIMHMLAFPEIQAKVQSEIDAAVGKDRMPGIEDRPKLSYTEAVLHESMRMATVAPCGFFHETTCETKLQGYRFPKGTAFLVNYWAIHHDPDEWESPEKFIPERYLDENGKMGPKPKSWIPFSAGKRVCLGEFVAKPELHLLFAALMQRYKWSREPGACVDIEPISTLFAHTPKHYKCVIQKRV